MSEQLVNMSDTGEESEFESADEGEEATGGVHHHSESKQTTIEAESHQSQLTTGHTSDTVDRNPADKTEDEEEEPENLESTKNENETIQIRDESMTKHPSPPPVDVSSSPSNDTKKNEGWEVEEDDDLVIPDDEESREVRNDCDHIERPREITPTRKVELRNSTVRDRSVLDKLNSAAESSQNSSWGWSNWGTSLLSTASSSVATLTTQFGQGLNTVLDTVESTLGAPSPEELAAQRKSSDVTQESDNVSEVDVVGESDEREAHLFGTSIGSLGSKVITGGLDTLELIGRKTMDMLQEGDPGLKKKRALLKTEKPSLSEVLREAKEKAKEILSLNAEDKSKELVHFGTIFDEQQGLVHLEALEMLSKQCEQKVQLALLDLIGDELQDVRTQLSQIEERCALEEVDDTSSDADDVDGRFTQIEPKQFDKINIVVNLEKLLKTQADGKSWLRNCTEEQENGLAKDPAEIYENAIRFLAQLTAKAIEVLHKVCELILVSSDGNINEEIDHLTGFGNSCCAEVSMQSAKYSSCLNTAADDSEDPDAVGPLITNVFLEASNSTTYIQDVFQLAVPIFQLKLLNKEETS